MNSARVGGELQNNEGLWPLLAIRYTQDYGRSSRFITHTVGRTDTKPPLAHPALVATPWFRLSVCSSTRPGPVRRVMKKPSPLKRILRTPPTYWMS